MGFFLIILSNFSGIVFAEIGQPNATVITKLQIGNVFPEVLYVSVNGGEAITLIPNSTRNVYCLAVVRDYNGEADIGNVSAEFFHNVNSSYGAVDLGINHYTNVSCNLSTTFDYLGFDDENTVLANCSFSVQYYAIPGTWNCTVLASDINHWNATGSNTTTVSELLAVGLPDEIDYGLVNATFVSGERMANVTNFGNVQINISLSGYAHYEGDGVALNCTLGTVKNISVHYEKYNLTASNPGDLNFATFDSLYLNLSSSPIVRRFELNSKQTDDAVLSLNSTYWRVYVPLGVAGSCRGNIIFGATQDGESG